MCVLFLVSDEKFSMGKLEWKVLNNSEVNNEKKNAHARYFKLFYFGISTYFNVVFFWQQTQSCFLLWPVNLIGRQALMESRGKWEFAMSIKSTLSLWVKKYNSVSNCYLIIWALKIWVKTQPQKINIVQQKHSCFISIEHMEL
jgi:hypothetical protein